MKIVHKYRETHYKIIQNAEVEKKTQAATSYENNVTN